MRARAVKNDQQGEKELHEVEVELRENLWLKVFTLQREDEKFLNVTLNNKVHESIDDAKSCAISLARNAPGLIFNNMGDYFIHIYNCCTPESIEDGEEYPSDDMTEKIAIFSLEPQDKEMWPDIPTEHNKVRITVLVSSDGDEDVREVATFRQ